MKPTYSDAGKLAWYPDIACPVCGGDVNSWDKRCSRALGYRQIVCEGCISEEYRLRGRVRHAEAGFLFQRT